MTSYTVFSHSHDRDDDPTVWAQHPPVEAGSPDAAIKRIRDASPALKTDKAALFFAVPNFAPKRMRRRLVESWELAPANEPDDEPTQGTLA